MVQKFALFEKLAKRSGFVRAELFTVRNGELEGAALQMAEQDFDVVGIDVGAFGRALEKVVGMLDDVLIERRAGGDQDGGRGRLAAPRTAGALPGGGDRARVAGHDYGIE